VLITANGLVRDRTALPNIATEAIVSHPEMKQAACLLNDSRRTTDRCRHAAAMESKYRGGNRIQAGAVARPVYGAEKLEELAAHGGIRFDREPVECLFKSVHVGVQGK